MAYSDINVGVNVQGMPPLISSEAMRPMMTALLLGLKDAFASIETEAGLAATRAVGDSKNQLEEAKQDRQRYEKYWSDEMTKTRKLEAEIKKLKDDFIAAQTISHCKFNEQNKKVE